MHVCLSRLRGDVVPGGTSRPEPGVWVEREDDAVRACTQDQLPWWFDDELWQVELEGDVRSLGRALTAPKARLVHRVEEWTDAAAMEFVLACATRVRDGAVTALVAEGRDSEASMLASADGLREIEDVAGSIAGVRDGGSVLAGLAADVVLYARDARVASRAAGVAAYVAAFALAGGDKAAAGYEGRFEAARRWQAEWLKERLRL